MRPPVRTISRGRKAVYAAATLILVVGVSEVLALAALSAVYRAPMTPSRLRSAITETVVSRTEAGWDDEYVDWTGWANMFTIHPYLGYVFDEDFEHEPRLDLGGPDAVNYGFSLAEYGVFFDPDPRTLVAVVTGGSVAFNVGRRYGDHIRDVVAAGLQDDFDRVIVVNAAIPGHHQPQQLLLINYLLTLGAHFDVVINLDGFNEIALSPEENLSKGVASYFPYAWYFKIADFGAESRLAVATMALLERRRRGYAGFFTGKPWRWSSTAGAVWLLLDRSAVHRMAAIDASLVEQRENGQERYVVTGPRHRYTDRIAVQQHAAEIWYRSSALLHDTCAGAGTRYFHFLQPNQYVADSKPMTHDERISVVHWELAISRYARDGYPLLIAYGQQLRERGVSFHDLTMIFSRTLEPTYGDDCCHLNSLGDQMVAQAIGDAIVDDFRAAKGEGAN